MNQADLRQIEIDFDVHQLIELEKRGFYESENDALRRLLGLDSSSDSKAQTHARTTAGGWDAKGVHLPNGTKLKCNTVATSTAVR